MCTHIIHICYQWCGCNINHTTLHKILKTTVLNNNGSKHPFISRAVAYGRLGDHGCHLSTNIIKIAVSDGTPGDLKTCVSYFLQVCTTALNTLTYILFGLVCFHWCGNTASTNSDRKFFPRVLMCAATF